jgi:hypothetical protein
VNFVRCVQVNQLARLTLCILSLCGATILVYLRSVDEERTYGMGLLEMEEVGSSWLVATFCYASYFESLQEFTILEAQGCLLLLLQGSSAPQNAG